MGLLVSFDLGGSVEYCVAPTVLDVVIYHMKIPALGAGLTSDAETGHVEQGLSILRRRCLRDAEQKKDANKNRTPL